MSDPINIRALAPGTRIILSDGAAAEVVSNPADGVWLFARYLTSPRDPALVGPGGDDLRRGRRRGAIRGVGFAAGGPGSDHQAAECRGALAAETFPLPTLA
jgi:hypothetical protein